MTTQTPPTMSREEMIGALVADKFAAFLELEYQDFHDSGTVYGRRDRGVEKYVDYIAETRKARRRYTAHLKTLSRAELDKLFGEMQSEIARRSPDHERFFYNEPFANAEYDHWVRQPAWSMEEATALLLGKDPDVIDLLALRNFNGAIGFAAKFNRLLYKLQEAKERGELSENVPPMALIAWARAHQIEVPSELTASIEAHIAGMPKQHPQETQGEPDGRAVTPNERTAWAKEKESLLKMVIAMAIRGYGYDPRALKSDVPGEIVNDLAELGISLDGDTVRKHLRAGAELVDQGALNERAPKKRSRRS